MEDSQTFAYIQTKNKRTMTSWSSQQQECNDSKEGILLRELSPKSKPTFYPCTVFRKPHPLTEGALSYRRPADDCIVYYTTGGVTVDSSIVYDVLLSSHQMECARKNRQLTALIKSLILVPKTKMKPTILRSTEVPKEYASGIFLNDLIFSQMAFSNRK